MSPRTPIIIIASTALVSALLLAFLLNHQSRALHSAQQDADALRLTLAHQVVADEQTRRELQGSVQDLLSKNAALKAAYEEAQRAAPDARPVSTAHLSTGPLAVVAPEPEAEGERPPAPPQCPAGQILKADGSACQQSGVAPKPPACVLSVGDTLSIEVDQIELHTKAGSSILAGVARALAHGKVLVEGRFQAAASVTAELQVPLAPRWGAYAEGTCQREGCGVGGGVMLPPLSFLGLRLEPALGVYAGPATGARASLGVRW